MCASKLTFISSRSRRRERRKSNAASCAFRGLMTCSIICSSVTDRALSSREAIVTPQDDVDSATRGSETLEKVYRAEKRWAWCFLTRHSCNLLTLAHHASVSSHLLGNAAYFRRCERHAAHRIEKNGHAVLQSLQARFVVRPHRLGTERVHIKRGESTRSVRNDSFGVNVAQSIIVVRTLRASYSGSGVAWSFLTIIVMRRLALERPVENFEWLDCESIGLLNKLAPLLRVALHFSPSFLNILRILIISNKESEHIYCTYAMRQIS